MPDNYMSYVVGHPQRPESNLHIFYVGYICKKLAKNLKEKVKRRNKRKKK